MCWMCKIHASCASMFVQNSKNCCVNFSSQTVCDHSYKSHSVSQKWTEQRNVISQQPFSSVLGSVLTRSSIKILKVSQNMSTETAHQKTTRLLKSKANWSIARQIKPKQSKANQTKAKQCKAKQTKARQSTVNQGKANKAREIKANQSKARQIIA